MGEGVNFFSGKEVSENTKRGVLLEAVPFLSKLNDGKLWADISSH